MNKRSFLKSAVLAGTAVIAGNNSKAFNTLPESSTHKKGKRKNYVWINPHHNDSESDLQSRYASYKDSGIDGIFFEADSEKHYRIAKSKKLEAHRWMWIMNRGEKELLQAHPEWYAKSRNGDSCATQPPYVGYYRWLCPSREEVAAYLETQVQQTLAKDYVDGIHLDYIRYCDVILPLNLWKDYKIEQTKELPEYDFCYCEVCRQKFKELKGVDPLELQFPEASLSWRKFRYDNITRVVNRLALKAKTYKKPVTAAVFPTPEIAKRNVRQDWVNWHLDAVFPMIYHGFYKENVNWIGDAVEEGVQALHGKFPLYAGLYLPDFKNHDEIRQGIKNAYAKGAAGVSLFGKVDAPVLKILKELNS